MGKKKKSKGGLTRNRRQKILALSRAKYVKTRSGFLSDSPFGEKPTGGVTVVVKPIVGGKVVAGKKSAYRARLYKKFSSMPAPHVRTIASRLVEASTQEVIAGLGIEILNISSDTELIHTVGRLVAKRAVSMAKEYVAAGSHGGGSRMRASGIIASIGRTGFDVEIRPSGDVPTRVSTTTSRRSRYKKTVYSSETTVPKEKPSKRGEETRIEVGHKSVVKRKDGSTTIHIDNLNVYITVLHADDMIVSQQTTLTTVESHKDEIEAATLLKEPDEVVVEKEDYDNENRQDPDQSEEKKKAKKRDEDEEENRA